MELSFLLSTAFIVLFLLILSLIYSVNSKNKKIGYYRSIADNLLNRQDNLISNIAQLEEEIKKLKSLPSPPKNLTVEAQQILHDMTAHGQSIVRIIPLSPSDIFWRSPS